MCGSPSKRCAAFMFTGAVIWQMVTGGYSCSRIETTYRQKCRLKCWPVLAPQASTNRLLFTRAFKLHAIITILDGRILPLDDIVLVVSRLDDTGKLCDGVEATRRWIILFIMPPATDQRIHRCMHHGCKGRINKNAPSKAAVVIDGMEVCHMQIATVMWQCMNHCNVRLSLVW